MILRFGPESIATTNEPESMSKTPCKPLQQAVVCFH